MALVYFETYGCNLSYSESEAIALELKRHILVEKVEDAQVIVLNTCIVTETTERKILKRIRHLCDTLDDQTLIVTGCAPNVLSADVWGRYPEATVVESKLVVPFINSKFERGGIPDRSYAQNTATARIKIAHGCLGQCSYCIVRLARGRIQSKSVETIRREIELQAKRGVKQVLLAAQDAGAYGIDIGSNLPELVNALCDLDYDFKLRIGMMNVTSLHDIIDDLLNAFDNPKVYKFVHLPVQSGSDRILRLMKRGHTALDFERHVSAFKRRFPQITLSTDFIVGFPTETEDDFQSTLKLLHSTQPVKVNITRFSPRLGTQAASLDFVTSRIVKDRSRILTAEHHYSAYQKNCTLIGKRYTALAVEHGKKGGTVLYNDNYRPIVVPQKLPLGASYVVEITQVTPTYLRGDVQ